MASRRGAGNLGQNAEIGDLIVALSKKNTQLERSMSKMGGSSDTAEFREQLTRQRHEGKDLCRRAFEAIKQATGSSRGGESASHLKKLSSQFEQAMEKYRHLAQEIERKEQQFLDVMTHNAGSRGSDAAAAGDHYQRMQQQDLEDQVQFSREDVNEIQRKADSIRQIERDVTELSEMFNDLQTLVVTQGDVIDSIEEHIVEAKDQTVSAEKELKTAEEYQKSARKKQCCLLFLVLGIIVAIVLAGVFIFKK